MPLFLLWLRPEKQNNNTKEKYMEKIIFDNGIRDYKLGSGVLRFNPGDPNLYARFLEAAEKIQAMEKELLQQAKTMESSGEHVVKLLQEADSKMKQTLGWVFGEANDFDKLLGGVNLLAVASNGERVVTNLFNALQPILVAGAKALTKEKVDAAVSKAASRRTGN